MNKNPFKKRSRKLSELDYLQEDYLLEYWLEIWRLKNEQNI